MAYLLVGEAAHAQSLCLELTQRLSLAQVFTLLLGGCEINCQRRTLRKWGDNLFDCETNCL